MTRRLTGEELGLLRAVVGKRLPCLDRVVEQAAVGLITAEEGEALRLVLLDEFLEELDEDSEPNPRGVKLDHLIDALAKVTSVIDRRVNEEMVAQILDCQGRTKPNP